MNDDGATQRPFHLTRDGYDPILIFYGGLLVVLLGILFLVLREAAQVILLMICGIISALRTLAHLSRGWTKGNRQAIAAGVQCAAETCGMLLMSSLAAVVAYPFAFVVPWVAVGMTAGEGPAWLAGGWFALAVSGVAFVYTFGKLAPGRVFSPAPPFDPSRPNR